MKRSELICLLLIVGPVFGHWNCNQQICLKHLDGRHTWSEASRLCSRLRSQLPDFEMKVWKNSILNETIWSSLCVLNRRLQWLGSNSREMTRLEQIDEFWPRAASTRDGSCFTLDGRIQPEGSRFPAVCVSFQPEDPVDSGVRISNAQVVTLGSDVDWGPVGQNRDGFVSLFDERFRTFRLECRVEWTGGSSQELRFQWLRNGAYKGVDSQVVTFKSKDELIGWIGLIQCQASTPGSDPVSAPGLHLALWNTVTLNLTVDCSSCIWSAILQSAELLTRRWIEQQFGSGLGNRTDWHVREGPVMDSANQSWIVVHLRNANISQFDYHTVLRMGSQLDLGDSPVPLRLTPISPCYLGRPEDQIQNGQWNLTWIGYRGQLVPSGNLIGGPICVDRDGHVITRSCGLPQPSQHQVCADAKIRREEPPCWIGYQHLDGHCYSLVPRTTMITALQRCKIPADGLNPTSFNLAKWIDRSLEFSRKAGVNLTDFWLPIWRPNAFGLLRFPSWDATRQYRWMLGYPQSIIVGRLDASRVELESPCVVYDVQSQQLVGRQCTEEHQMVCWHPQLDGPLSQSLGDQPRTVGSDFCPDGWVTHRLVSNERVCYRRFVAEDPIDWDEAASRCRSQGSKLATAPTEHLRIVLEQVYQQFNKESVVDSWIGLRMVGDGNPARFVWNEDDVPNHIYNWQPYNEFGLGHGVSTGISRRWWTWPSDVRIWGYICQKTVADWRRHFHLQLRPVESQVYQLILTHDPPLEIESGTWNRQRPWARWNIVCNAANIYRRFEVRSEAKRVTVWNFGVPRSFSSGSFSCEAWSNQTSFRLQSNRLFHQSAHTFTFIIRLAVDSWNNGWNTDTIEKDLIQKLQSNFKGFDFNSHLMSTWISTGKGSSTVNHRIAITLPPTVGAEHLLFLGRNCSMVQSSSGAHDREGALWAVLQSCLSLIYSERTTGPVFRLLELRSTVACPAETSGGLDWPRTPVGFTTRPSTLCLLKRGSSIRRRCVGGYEAGASWNALDERFGCEPGDSTLAKLFQLELSSRKVGNASITSTLIQIYEIVSYTVASTGQIELVVDTLNNLLETGDVQETDCRLAMKILEQVFSRSNRDLTAFQFIPDNFDALVRVVVDLSIRSNSSSRRLRFLGLSVLQQTLQFERVGDFFSAVVSSDSVKVQIVGDSDDFDGGRFEKATLVTLESLRFTLDFSSIVYQRDVDDPDVLIRHDHLEPRSVVAGIQLESDGRVFPTLLFFFRLLDPEETSNLTCAQWDWQVTASGAWNGDDCIFLGYWNESAVCQCRFEGTVALFGPQRARSTDSQSLTTPILVGAIIFWIASAAVILYFHLLHPSKDPKTGLSSHLYWIESRMLLQILISWSALLAVQLIQRSVVGQNLACLLVTTLWQYLLFVPSLWFTTLVLYHRHQLLNHPIPNPVTFLVKNSFFAWTLPSVVIITIPIYKWDLTFIEFNNSEQCQLEQTDRLLTLIVATIANSISAALIASNWRLKRESVSPRLVWNDYYIIISDAILVYLVAILAVVSHSDWQTVFTNSVYCIVILALVVSWAFTYRRLFRQGNEFDYSPSASAAEMTSRPYKISTQSR